jgi:hypothetical protein
LRHVLKLIEFGWLLFTFTLVRLRGKNKLQLWLSVLCIVARIRTRISGPAHHAASMATAITAALTG